MMRNRMMLQKIKTTVYKLVIDYKRASVYVLKNGGFTKGYK